MENWEVELPELGYTQAEAKIRIATLLGDSLSIIINCYKNDIT